MATVFKCYTDWKFKFKSRGIDLCAGLRLFQLRESRPQHMSYK